MADRLKAAKNQQIIQELKLKTAASYDKEGNLHVSGRIHNDVMDLRVMTGWECLLVDGTKE